VQAAVEKMLEYARLHPEEVPLGLEILPGVEALLKELHSRNNVLVGLVRVPPSAVLNSTACPPTDVAEVANQTLVTLGQAEAEGEVLSFVVMPTGRCHANAWMVILSFSVLPLSQ
jgi:fructose-bisphosphate aldolase class 1